MQSRGSGLFSRCRAAKSAACAAKGPLGWSEEDPSLFGAGCGCEEACGEWQSVQPTSLRQCSPRMKLLCSSRPEWHARHVSEICLEDSPWKVRILVLSPPASTCALPGPWQDSQPTTFPCQLFSCRSLEW